MEKVKKEAKTLRIDILIDSYDVGDDFPLSKKVKYDDIFRRWCVDIDIESGTIKNWKTRREGYDDDDPNEEELFVKVVDTGRYYLLDEDDKVIASIKGYVPNKLIPPKDGYGDYIHLFIDESGKITNWYEKPDLSEFERQ